MSLESIKHNAKNIQEAYKIYAKLDAAKQPKKEKLEKMKKYMMKLSENIKRAIVEERKNVR